MGVSWQKDKYSLSAYLPAGSGTHRLARILPVIDSKSIGRHRQMACIIGKDVDGTSMDLLFELSSGCMVAQMYYLVK